MKRTTTRTVLAAAVCFAASWIGAPARAEGERTARAVFGGAVEAFNDGRYEEAVGLFREANRMNPSWKILFNIAQCEAALKRYGLAIEFFERYMAEGGDEISSERMDKVINELRRLRELVGTITVEAPEGVEVRIDGINRGTTPMAAGLRVTAMKEHEVRLLRDGVEIHAQPVMVGGGQSAKVTAPKTAPAETAPMEPSDVEETPVAGEGDGPAETAPTPEDAEEGSSKIKPLFFWLGLGATGLFGAGTVVMNFVVQSQYDEAKKNPRDEDLVASGEASQVVGYVMLGLTGAALVTTAVLAGVTDFKGEDAKRDVALTPVVAPGGGGVAASWRF